MPIRVVARDETGAPAGRVDIICQWCGTRETVSDEAGGCDLAGLDRWREGHACPEPVISDEKRAEYRRAMAEITRKMQPLILSVDCAEGRCVDCRLLAGDCKHGCHGGGVSRHVR